MKLFSRKSVKERSIVSMIKKRDNMDNFWLRIIVCKTWYELTIFSFIFTFAGDSVLLKNDHKKDDVDQTDKCTE